MEPCLLKAENQKYVKISTLKSRKILLKIPFLTIFKRKS